MVRFDEMRQAKMVSVAVGFACDRKSDDKGWRKKMANIHFQKKLIHRCTVQRNAPVQSSSGELIDAWTDVADANCRYVQKQERIADPGSGFPMLMADMLLMNNDVDVIEEDQIVDIVFRVSGAAVDAGPFRIEGLLQRNTGSSHHISATLERAE